ncbi:MAG: DUF6468 domain-containing protein [Alphaproteobacteria bacterium]|nr:DUF6468 domain-containing protein [Alphaproteobacteria bacterium]
MPPFVGLFFDIIILAALGITIFYCFRLSRQLNQMRANRAAFDALIRSLDAATARAEAVIRSLKEGALGSGDALQDKINKSRAICEELEIMIQAGDSIADRLQVLAERGRSGQPPGEAKDTLQAEAPPRTRAERELLEAIRAKQQA